MKDHTWIPIKRGAVSRVLKTIVLGPQGNARHQKDAQDLFELLAPTNAVRLYEPALLNLQDDEFCYFPHYNLNVMSMIRAVLAGSDQIERRMTARYLLSLVLQADWDELDAAEKLLAYDAAGHIRFVSALWADTEHKLRRVLVNVNGERGTEAMNFPSFQAALAALALR